MEINRMLEQRPEYKPYQQMIEDKLNRAHTKHNRLVIINEMMMDKLRELHSVLKGFKT